MYFTRKEATLYSLSGQIESIVGQIPKMTPPIKSANLCRELLIELKIGIVSIQKAGCGIYISCLNEKRISMEKFPHFELNWRRAISAQH